MVHDQLHDFVRLFIQHNWSCVPSYDHIINNHHRLILDTPAVVHNQLHDLVRLYFQYNW